MEKLLFIYNPNAGTGKIRNSVSEILERLSDAGYRLSVFPTSKQGDASDFAFKHCSKYDYLVASGGDGTLNEVVNGMMAALLAGKKVPKLGYIPAGTVNDFASSLEIPKSVGHAIDVLINGVEKPTDIGSFCVGSSEKLHGFFTYVAAFGAFTDVAYETPQETKNVIGKAAYFLEGIKRLQYIRPYHIKVTYDDTTIEDDFIYGMVSNSKSVGGFKGITGPNVYLDDGKFDAILIKSPRNPVELQSIINSMINMEKTTDSLYHFHAGKISFSSNEKIQWTLDGESGGAHNEVVINDHMQALNIIVPDRSRNFE